MQTKGNKIATIRKVEW